ncbi:hypothetical protein DHEL01_v200047 [Diaporthe helianthi]|uniref:Ricin B lectin domain-containing protein n=1 Tax=Diaporthe helianthi TaxID=158607 RepID=A0A2P5IG94_DIAHE|nr:hypothetical protein DHEL01_v200047 [Diaporthe helianthi]
MLFKLVLFLASAALASTNPVTHARAVNSLDQAAIAEAHRPDTTVTRASSDIRIKTFDGKCLSVDKLSGDFRANLTPIQVTQCGAAEGQGWDIVTAGKHISTSNSIIIVSTTTGACVTFDPRRAAGDQVLLFSCGGRADGSGKETNSQVFPFSQSDGSQSLQPQNAPGKCLAVKNNFLDISDCSSGDVAQEFLFGEQTTSVSGNTAGTGNTRKSTGPGCYVAPHFANGLVATSTAASPMQASGTTGSSTQASSIAGVNPTQSTAVSDGAGGIDRPAVEEAQQRDDTAARAASSTKIRASNGQCLTVDPFAGDFRMNLIPVTLVDCSNTTRWDLITSGKHNDGSGGNATLLVSTATQGCISFDGRREPADRVNMFSCGGRADGSGETNHGQLFPFAGGDSFELSPVSEGNKTCLNVGHQRLVAGPCGDPAGLFTLES